jgi:hypothetical protein
MEIYGADFLTTSFVIYVSKLHHHHKEINNETKRKRTEESGPGLFGSNSRLTNGKNGQKNEIMVKKGASVESMEGEREGGPEEGNKKIKIALIEMNKDNEDEDSDNDIKSSSCTSSYCPPCYELA